MPVVAAFMSKTGLPMASLVRLTGVLFAASGLAFLYRYSIHVDRRRALTAVFILAGSALYVRWSHYFLTSIPAGLLILLAVYLVRDRRFLAAGLASSLAFLTRYPGALIGPAVVVFLLIRYVRTGNIHRLVRDGMIYSTGVLLLAVPFMAFNQVLYGEMLHSVLSGATVPALNPDKYLFGLWYPVNMMLSALPVSSLLVTGGIAASLTQLKLRREKLDLPVIAFSTLYIFFTIYPHKLNRFMLLLLPLGAFLTSDLLHTLTEYLSEPDYPLKGFSLLHMILLISLAASSFAVAEQSTGRLDERKEFLSATEDLTGTVLSNSPSTIVGGGFRYIPVRPEHLGQGPMLDVNSCTSRKDTGFCKVSSEKVDHVAINRCSWYCTPAIENCEENIRRFEDRLNKSFEEVYSSRGGRCDYYVYSR
mgnify:FL=1